MLLLTGRPTLDEVIARCASLYELLQSVKISVIVFGKTCDVPEHRAFVVGISAQQKAVALRRVGAKVEIVSWGPLARPHPFRHRDQIFGFYRPAAAVSRGVFACMAVCRRLGLLRYIALATLMQPAL
jgi:hypothetical protein